MPNKDGKLVVFGDEFDPAVIENHPLASKNRVRLAKNQIDAIMADLNPDQIAELRQELRDKELNDWLEVIITVH